MKKEFQFDRSLLPTPAKYYSHEFPGLKIKSEWVLVRCCFHEDRKPSLNISMIDGHFKCHACGTKGCDIISFHRQRYNIGFIATLKGLGVHHG